MNTASSYRMSEVVAAESRRRRRLHQVRRGFLYVFLALFCLATVFPIYWMIVSAIQPVQYSLQYPPPLFPQEISFAPFVKLFDNFPVGSWLINTIFLAALTTGLTMILSVLGAYALSSLQHWRGQGLFGFMLLMTQMLPEVLLVIPIYAMYQRFNMKESLPNLALVDTAFVLPLGVWILKNMFDTIPPEIGDAAMVDGCTPLGVLWRIILPLTTPGMVAVGVVAFFYAWNEYLFAASLITEQSLTPASVGLASLRTMLDTPIDRVLAAALFFSIFPVIFYIAVQRYVVAGLSAGAIKG
jgi:multiple sugar transport system permease protein